MHNIHKNSFSVLTLVFVFGLVMPPVRAQNRYQLSEEATLSLITIYPGNAIYSMYGHSAIRVVDTIQNIDWSFNYGTFHFDKLFLPRFLYGKLHYYLSVHSFSLALENYRAQERSVIEQALDLSHDQKERLFYLLTENARDENRYYRYDFLFDNCSTRIRDILKQALGTQLLFSSENDPQLSFRRLLDPYNIERPLLDLGIDLILGIPTDRIATPRETMFLPMYLKAAFDSASIEEEGEYRPLVIRIDTVFWIEGGDQADGKIPWINWVCWLLLFGGIWVSYVNVRKGTSVIRFFDVPLFAVIGLGGLLIVFLWFFSLHHVTANNVNLFWLWPTYLVAAFVLLRRKKPIPRWLTLHALLSAVFTLIILAGWSVWPQDLHTAAIPVMLLLTLRNSLLARRLPQEKAL